MHLLNLQNVINVASRKSEGFKYEMSQSSFTLHEDGTSKIMGIEDWEELSREDTLKYILSLLEEYFIEDE